MASTMSRTRQPAGRTLRLASHTGAGQHQLARGHSGQQDPGASASAMVTGAAPRSPSQLMHWPGSLAWRSSLNPGLRRGGQDAAVPEHLADFSQRPDYGEHGGGGAMPQPVRVDRAKPGRLGGGCHCHGDPVCGQAGSWCPAPDEHAAAQPPGSADRPCTS
jgi:hypothetical protein